MELWALFAKQGRVGEVCMPKKRDKRGNRFGFVKFKDVKSVEALSKRLKEIWIGSFKLRINLSRFARKNVPSHSTQEKTPTAQTNQPFKQTLQKGKPDHSSSMVATVEVGVAREFLQTLEGSYVGRLGDGVEIRALQTKLWLAGLHLVRVVAMGGDLVLIMHNSGEEILGPISKKNWWGGLLFDIKRWTPNMVSSKRVLWVNLFGIPLHAWEEATFVSLANRCGKFISLDADTKNRNRFDVARVKIEAPICEKIDFNLKLMIHGAGYWVRVMEDGGRLVEGDEVEDQLHVEDVISSCDSGGQAAEMVVVDELNRGDTDCEESEGVQGLVPVEVQVSSKSTTDKVDVGVSGEKSEGVSGTTRVIPSICTLVKETAENFCKKAPETLRGPTSLISVECGGESLVGQDLPAQKANGTRLETVMVPVHVGPVLNQIPPAGSGLLDQDNGSVPLVDLGLTHTQTNLDRTELVGPFPQKLDGEMTAGPVITTLDDLIIQAHGKGVTKAICSELSKEESHGSSANPLLTNIGVKSSQIFPNLQRVPKLQIPLTTLLGPKCLRFAGIVSNTINSKKTRRIGELNDSVSSELQSLPPPVQVSDANAIGDKMLTVEVGNTSKENSRPGDLVENMVSEESPGPVLEVVLPFPFVNRNQSGVEHLLREESLQDVEGYLASRDNPAVNVLEAEKLLGEQQKVGFNFDQQEPAPIARMVGMEGKDREEFAKNQGSNHPQ
jgi:hypothetical protein